MIKPLLMKGRYGPRTLDIDILFYDSILVSTPSLVIPHPLIQERDFVLGPLLEYNLLFVIYYLTLIFCVA